MDKQTPQFLLESDNDSEEEVGPFRRRWRKFQKTDLYRITIDVFAGGVPVGLLLIGVLFVVLGSIAEDPKTLSRVSSGLGSAMVAGGIFSVILKSMQFRGVYHDVLSKILYDEPYLKNRNDLPKLWSKVTALISKERFSELNEHMHETVMKHYIPTYTDFYYEKYNRTCVVNWHDKDAGELEVFEELDLDIIPTSADAKISYVFSSSNIPDVPLEASCPEVEFLEINGKEKIKNGEKVSKDVIITIKEEDDADVYGVEIVLTGSKKYEVRRRSRRTFLVDADPYQRYKSARFIKGAKINVQCVAEDLRVRFVSLGTPQDFESYSPRNIGAETRKGDINREYPKLLFPQQGYLLVFHRFDEKTKNALEKIKADAAAAAAAKAKVEKTSQDQPS